MAFSQFVVDQDLHAEVEETAQKVEKSETDASIATSAAPGQ